ncbi:MAG: hypothetical protein M1337_05495 [Actinobacteria bacterium]|nr:hypothetical protein [Actinomycetota bacterium]
MTTQNANPISGTSKLSRLEEFEALLEWPGLYLLADACDEYRRAQGQRVHTDGPFPTSLLLFAAMSARVTGSLASAIKALADDATWEALEPVWDERADRETGGRPFPGQCPNREQVKYFMKSLLGPSNWAPSERQQSPTFIAFLQDRFQRIAMKQAKTQGHLIAPDAIDWTRPAKENTIIGDGTVVSRYSDVSAWVDEMTGEVFYTGSRALGTPRLSPVTNLSEDNKTSLFGLNMVSMLTATDHGWVVLGTGYANAAEQWASLDLLDSIAARADGGVVNLLWDGVYRGWLLDYTTARHGIRVFNKSVEDSALRRPDRTPDIDDEMVSEVSESELRRNADVMLEAIDGEGIKKVRVAQFSTDEVNEWRIGALAANKHHWRASDLQRLYDSGVPLPLGISLYRSTSARSTPTHRGAHNRPTFDLVRSRAMHVGAVTHDGDCTHHLWTDDGALHSVQSDGTYLVKASTAKCTSSTRHVARHDSAGPVYGTKETWVLTCENGRGDLTYETTWEPSPNRYTTTYKRDSKVPHSFLNDLRPIARSQEQDFADTVNARNNSESYNNWFKRRLPGGLGRANTLSIEAQLFDYLAGACVRNAITWSTWLRS